MSDDDFLSRWSRRKREAAQSDRSPQSAGAPEPSGGSPSAPVAPAASAKTEPANTEKEEFDLASLPSIDSITAATDITAFLRKGVPLELSRAALRRAWLADPVIRDFIGPAENAWDFNDPNAMPGFGVLDQTPEQLCEMAARIVGQVRNVTEELATASDEGAPQSAAGDFRPSNTVFSADSQSPPAAEALPIESKTAFAADDALGSTAEPRVDAVQKDGPQNDQPKVHRTHGGALPR
jgi:hypothetical protein